MLMGILSPLEAFAAAGGAKGAYATRKSQANDLRIGNFALTLEYLEAEFYKLTPTSPDSRASSPSTRPRMSRR